MTGFFILLLTSLTFVITGHYMARRPPEKPNRLFGYRTKRSRASQEAWDFAQKYSSEWMVKTGYFLGIFSTVFLLFPDNTTSMVLGVGFTLLGCLAPLYITERELKKRFD